MPLYEYVCRACDTDFEALVPASRRDAADRACPQCGTVKAARKISLTAQPVVKAAGASEPFNCGAPGGCCGGTCGFE
ncbi:MAG: zinc ribbon domain-containing protein [Armatimonadota bacterium]|nr:zinc ribbon domain-containing protein [Armatimonadota bacterium]